MKFVPSVPAAYAPTQLAAGVDSEGRTCLFLYVPQWREIVERLRERTPPPAAEWQWAFSRELQTPILFFRWESGEEIAVSFRPGQVREALAWWEKHGRVDVIFSAKAFPQVEEETLGEDASQALRVRDVPFLTEST